MKISELVGKMGLKALSEFKDRDVGGVYISDMVSDIITGPRTGNVLVTLQTHKSLIAAANLVGVAMIVVAKGRRPAADVVELAAKAGIALFTSDRDTWGLAKGLVELGF
jgi:hypothetical protein